MVKSVQEPQYLLHQPDVDKQKRLDLLCVIPENMIDVSNGLDMSMVGPFSGSRIGKPFVNHNVAANAAIPKDLEDRKAIARKTEKINKYEALCQARGITFVPFIMNTTGKIHEDAMKFLKKLAIHGHEVRDIPVQILMNYSSSS